jgi:hypothetical protein
MLYEHNLDKNADMPYSKLQMSRQLYVRIDCTSQKITPTNSVIGV